MAIRKGSGKWEDGEKEKRGLLLKDAAEQVSRTAGLPVSRLGARSRLGEKLLI